MDKLFWFLYDFILLFLLFYIIESVFVDKKKRSFSKLRKSDEIRLFVNRYNLNLEKLDYKEVRKTVYFINSFILSFTTALILNIKSVFLQMVISFIVVFALMYSLFEIFGRKLKNKERIN